MAELFSSAGLAEEPLRPVPAAVLCGGYFPVTPDVLNTMILGREQPFFPVPSWPPPRVRAPWREGRAGEWFKFSYLSSQWTLQRVASENNLVLDLMLSGPLKAYLHRRRIFPESGGSVLLEEIALEPGRALWPVAGSGVLMSMLQNALHRNHLAIGKWLGSGVQLIGEAEAADRLERLTGVRA